MNDQQDDWDDLIDNVLFAYRTSRQDSTKFTPFYLMHGREAMLPVDALVPHSERRSDDHEALEEKVETLVELQKNVHEQARGNIKKAQERQKKQYDKKHNTSTNIKVSILQFMSCMFSIVYVYRLVTKCLLR